MQEMSHKAHTDYIVPDAPLVASMADHLRSVDCRVHTRKAPLRRPAGEERTSCLLTIQFRLKGGNQRQSVIRLGFNSVDAPDELVRFPHKFVISLVQLV